MAMANWGSPIAGPRSRRVRAPRAAVRPRYAALALAGVALAAGSLTPAAAAGCSLGTSIDSDRPSVVHVVTRHRTFVVPNRATDRALVFGPFQVMQYRAGWTTSRSRSRTSGGASELDGESRRSFAFELLEPGAPRVAVDCAQRALAQEGAEAGRLVVDHELRCEVRGAGSGSWALDFTAGAGALTGTAGGRFEIRAGDALGRGRARPAGCEGFVVRDGGVPVLAIARTGKGRFELAAYLDPDVRRLLAAAGSALLLAEVDGS